MGDLIVTQPWSSGQTVTPFGLNEFLATAKIAPHAVTEAQLAMPSAPFGYLSGLTLSIDPGNPKGIQIAPGLARDDQDAVSMKLSAPFTKHPGSNWSAGVGNGGLDTGGLKPIWYHVFLIYNGTIADVLFSTSATFPTMPSGYAYKRRIGSVLIEAKETITPFFQIHDAFYYSKYITDIKLGPQPNGATITRKLTVPPGIRVMPIISIHGNGVLTVLPIVGGSSAANAAHVFPNGAMPFNFALWTNEQQEIATGHWAVNKLEIYTSGWIDLRGK